MTSGRKFWYDEKLKFQKGSLDNATDNWIIAAN